VIAAALRNPVSRLGVALTTASGFLFLVLLGFDLLGFFANPYAGIVVFIMVPALFVLGLLLIPVGVTIDRRRAARGVGGPPWPRLDLNDRTIRRSVFLVIGATVVNLIIVTVASFGAVEYTESQTFCGQACHAVMEPEFVAHQSGPHGRVPCVSCHVGPGAGGFLTAKLSGARQLAMAIRGTYSRPIPSPVNTVPDERATCERCHSPDRFVGDTIKAFYEHADDEGNSPTVTTVRLHIGGPIAGTGGGSGIHWHMNRANRIEFVALDEHREQIPYVRVSLPDGTVREYLAGGVTAADLEGRPRWRMGCRDCHNRPAHRFAASPEREVDAAIGASRISAKIPFIRREAVRALRRDYVSQDVALREIDRSIRAAMKTQANAPDETELRRAIGVTQAIYRTSVFPSMKVGWGTYPSQTGHMVSNGCFRCHDDGHKTSAGAVIRQDCDLCHTIE
jgi:hypothetical protein